ncbi:lipopolysaccharide biosynthesis protein [Lachnospira rogosae (ex Hitch et al. 2025)]
MLEKKSMKKAGTYYMFGTLFNKGIAFITVPIFTRILTVADYGVVTTYNAWESIAATFMSLALYMAIRASFIDYEDETEDYLSSILIFTLIYGSILTVIIWLIASFILSAQYIIIVVFCLLHSLGAALIENVSMYLMMNFCYKFRTAIMVLPNLISTTIAVVLIKWALKSKLYMGRIVPTAVVFFIFGISVALYFLPKGKIKLNKEYIMYGLKISLPLVLHGIALSILSQSDRTMITMLRNATETGIYGLIYNFSMVATVITTAFDGMWVPYFTRKMKEKAYADINRICIKYIELMTIAMIGVVLLAPEVVKIMATESYWDGIKVIPPIVLSNYLIFIYTLYVNVEHYYKKTVFISINTIIAAVVNIALNYFFILQWGYVGAAYTTLMSYGLSLILHCIYSRRLNDRVIPFKIIVLPSIMIVAVVLCFYIFINMWMIRWGIAFGCLAVLVINEREFLLNLVRNDN